MPTYKRGLPVTDASPQSAQLVPFGKYRGQPVEVAVADDGYREWTLAQPWVKTEYPVFYQILLTGGPPPEDTPEHNQMQARFLDEEVCWALARLRPGLVEGKQPGVSDIKFEDGGWDVTFGIPGEFLPVAAELKPDLGDDYPSVIRQVQRYMKTRRRFAYGEYQDVRTCCAAFVVARRAQFSSVTLEQVQRIFATSRISLVREEDLDGLIREVSAVNCSCSCGTTLRPGCRQGAHCGNESSGCKAYG